jgi:hypothetical protein
VLDALHTGLTAKRPGESPGPGADPPRDPGDAAGSGPPNEGGAGAEAGPDLAFEAVRNIFADAVERWRTKNGGTCDADITRRHGDAFGWKGGHPWPTWDDLKAARFAPPGSRPEDAVPLVDEKARTVRETLLIRVLRGEGVPQARGKRMPLNGPYLEEDQIEAIERYIAGRMRKPIS